VRSFRHALFASRLNVLLIFVPAGTVTYLTRAPPVAVFITNAIAIVPLSALLTDATERIAADAGDTVGALLNISLGNLVELILLYVYFLHCLFAQLHF
jgi:Ca2+:H+ antiporter